MNIIDEIKKVKTQGTIKYIIDDDALKIAVSYMKGDIELAQICKYLKISKGNFYTYIIRALRSGIYKDLISIELKKV
jgi:hypothetical protein